MLQVVLISELGSAPLHHQNSEITSQSTFCQPPRIVLHRAEVEHLLWLWVCGDHSSV